MVQFSTHAQLCPGVSDHLQKLKIPCVVSFVLTVDLLRLHRRVGRTGRAGDKEGCAHTLLLPGEARFAGQLVSSLMLAGQEVSKALAGLANKVGTGGRVRSL